MDEQKQLLQGLWRKAFRQGTALEIPCKTESNATRMRFALYNAVRGVRAGKEKVDDLLKLAVENCSVGFHPDDRTVVVMQRKVMTELMQTVAEILDGEPELRKTEEEMEVEASQALLMQKLREGAGGAGCAAESADAAGAGLPRVTPYYTR